jgi:hypothetical protein
MTFLFSFSSQGLPAVVPPSGPAWLGQGGNAAPPPGPGQGGNVAGGNAGAAPTAWLSASPSLDAKLKEIAELAKGVPGTALNGVQTLGGVKCYAKKEGFLARKENDACTDAGIMSSDACGAPRADVRRAFRAVLSYAVALAVGSTTILRTRPVTENGKIVAHCIDFAPAGALQPRRAPPDVKPMVLTYVADAIRFPPQPGTFLFPSKSDWRKGFKATEPMLSLRPQIGECLKQVDVLYDNTGMGQVGTKECSVCDVLAPAKLDVTTPQLEFRPFSPTCVVSYLQLHPIPLNSKLLSGHFYFQYTPSRPDCSAMGGCSVSSGSKPKTSMRNASRACAK